MRVAPSAIMCVALSLLSATAPGAGEQDAPANADSSSESKETSWGLGVGVLSRQQPYAGIDRENRAVPLIYFENRWVRLMGGGIELKLTDLEWENDQELKFGLIAQYDRSGYKPSDAPILNGMAKRKDAIWTGVSAEWSNKLVDVKTQWMTDVSGESDGQRASLGFERSFPLGSFVLTPGVTAVWLSSKYVDYYYGVRSAEVRADRPVYIADATVNAELSLRTDYRFTAHQSVFLQFEYVTLGKEIQDSPLTDRSGETQVFLGYLYRF